MGLLVQRQFTVDTDDRQEFERQSRLGIWEDMRYNGCQMIAYGGWAFGGSGDVMVTHSAYADFDHWTATRPWGFFRSEAARLEETKEIRAIAAGRPRLIRASRASMIVFDDYLSTPEVEWRDVGDPLAPIPESFGRQSVVEELRCELGEDDVDEFDQITSDVVLPHVELFGGRVLILGHDPQLKPPNRVSLIAYPDIENWLKAKEGIDQHPSPSVTDRVQKGIKEIERRAALTSSYTEKLLMVATDYGPLPKEKDVDR